MRWIAVLAVMLVAIGACTAVILLATVQVQTMVRALMSSSPSRPLTKSWRGASQSLVGARRSAGARR